MDHAVLHGKPFGDCFIKSYSEFKFSVRDCLILVDTDQSNCMFHCSYDIIANPAQAVCLASNLGGSQNCSQGRRINVANLPAILLPMYFISNFPSKTLSFRHITSFLSKCENYHFPSLNKSRVHGCMYCTRSEETMKLGT